jgi:outer membrane protein assembly factor BamB
MTETVRLRLWPAVAMLALTIATMVIVPFAFTRTMIHFAGLIGAPLTLALFTPLWWSFGSRARGASRWWPSIVFTLGTLALWATLYKREFVLPYQGEEVALGLYILAPIAAIWIIWAMVARNGSWSMLVRGAIAVITIGFAIGAMVRIDGADAAMVPTVRLAWQPTEADRLEAALAAERAAPPSTVEMSATVTITADDWAEFRGPKRDNAARGQAINIDWQNRPPKELWRRPVGAGWGSFSVAADRCFTMEQRGPDECIVCYHAATGRQLWEHRYPALFSEFIAKEGPRSTPMIADGRVYAYGATGRLTCLNALNGERFWQRDIVTDHGAKIPQWGFAASPLVVNGKVIVFSAVKGKAVVAYDANSGEPAWAAGNGQHGYSSAQFSNLRNRSIVLMVSDYGLEGFDPDAGKIALDHNWHFKGQNRVAQPMVLPGGDIIIGTAVGNGQGAQRIKAIRANDRYITYTEWSARGPKPYFNDGVYYDGHYYGFDDRNFVCVNVDSGKIVWTARDRYGFGQVLLVPDSKMLIVQSETGPIALVKATPDDFDEVSTLAAFESKTWNHSVLCRGRLYLRNNKEAVCYDLSP